MLIFIFVAGGLALGILASILTGYWVFAPLGYGLGVASFIILIEKLAQHRSKPANTRRT